MRRDGATRPLAQLAVQAQLGKQRLQPVEVVVRRVPHAPSMAGQGEREPACTKFTVNVGLTHATLGARYRIRTDYVRASKDTSNLSNDSPWQCFIVTS